MLAWAGMRVPPEVCIKTSHSGRIRVLWNSMGMVWAPICREVFFVFLSEFDRRIKNGVGYRKEMILR